MSNINTFELIESKKINISGKKWVPLKTIKMVQRGSPQKGGTVKITTLGFEPQVLTEHAKANGRSITYISFWTIDGHLSFSR